VCAPEVKKKFQKCESKKGRRPRIYFPEKICSRRGLSIAAKDASDVVAPAFRRHFCAGQQIQKLPAGRRRYKNLGSRTAPLKMFLS
jgi:hypothetical protein